MATGNSKRILCSFILNRDVVLVSHQESEGDIETDYSGIINATKDVTVDIPLSEESQKFTLQDESLNLKLHVIIKAGNVFGCVSPENVPQYICFLFLSKVSNQMSEQPSLIARSYRATEHEFDRDFKPVLSRLMEEFNRGKVEDKLTTVQEQVRDVKEIILRNVEQVVERGERLDDLLSKTNDLEAQGREFRRSARTLEIRMWWKSIWLWVTIGSIISLILLIVILYFANVFKH